MTSKLEFADFFCGSGLVTEALKPFFTASWANDIDPKKIQIYAKNHGWSHLHSGSIEQVKGQDLPLVDLAWASFPCQDLSLAGKMAGLAGKRSGLVVEWFRVLGEMKTLPPVVALENVQGLVSAHGGSAYRAIHLNLVGMGYKVGCMLLNADRWVPQSRPRIFVIGYRGEPPANLVDAGPSWNHPGSVVEAAEELPGWVWWKLPEPVVRTRELKDVLDAVASPVEDISTSKRNLSLIPPVHRTKLAQFFNQGGIVAPGYRRTRQGQQVLELRFDGIAGCLRTPEGGSSRQILVLNSPQGLTSRLLSPREAARLMGAPDSFWLPPIYNDAYKAMGDGVAIPVANALAKNLLFPLVKHGQVICSQSA
jgi:DNA (cytosine-5)-methyltransferase 1